MGVSKISITVCDKDDFFRFSKVTCCGSVMHSHHYHNFFEIYYLTDGACNFFIDDKTYDVIVGDIVMIPKGVIHKTNYGEDEHTRIVIECSASFIPPSLCDKYTNNVYLYRNADTAKETRELFKKIESEHLKNDDYTVECLNSLMTLLFFSIERNPNFAGAPEAKNRMIESVANYIKQNYNTDISLSAMAKNHFVSPEHLSRTFKRETGFGFNEFLTLVRLQHAENMLKEQETKSISEIAYNCGFNDSNYFSDKFKRVYGISPLRFSKINREKSIKKIEDK